MKRLFLLALVLYFASQPAFSQVYPTKYRPPNLNWQQLRTPHFNIVFPEGEDSVAYRTGRILEHEYPKVQKLVGGHLTNFPVVLNNFNDRSNGFVTTWHFRSEIEIPSIKGKAMNPQSGNWLETVMPHELVHAMQASHLEGIWADITNFFSPDLARSIHGSIPSGVTEGMATYYETARGAPGGGRGNYPYFTNRFDAVFNSPDRWSMGQLWQPPADTRPFNRYYIGGYEFTDWVQQTYGDSTTNQAIDFFIRWPFLGYGTALRHVTGQWPGQLYDQFETDHEEQLAEKNGSRYQALPIPYKGAEVRRPVWISEDKLLMHGQFYNGSAGFYTYRLSDGHFKQVLETRVVQDYNYDLSADRSALLFSNYRRNPFYDNTYKTDLHELDFASGSVNRLSRQLRAYAPVYYEGQYLALQTDAESSALVRLAPGGETLSVTETISLPNTEFISVKPNPATPGQLAIVANRRGLQGLWLVDAASITQQMRGAPEVSFMNGSVFDVAWHPAGNRLMFSSDYTGTTQLYEYNPSADELTQITAAAYNAMEGSFSPDGSRIAFISQQQHEQLPVLLDRSELQNKLITPATWKPSTEKRAFMQRGELGADLIEASANWETSAYRPGLSWLSPRAFIPFVEELSNSNSLQAGLTLSSNDLLLRNSYSLDFSYAQDRLWYDLTYRHSGFFPGVELSTFNQPSFRSFRVQGSNDQIRTFRFLRQNVGASVGIPARFVLEDNVQFTSLGITPSFKVRGTRYFEPVNTARPASKYANFVSGNVRATLNFKIQQNIRDMQPNSGLVLFSELEYAFSAEPTIIRTPSYQLSLTTQKSTALQSGMYLYAAPLRRWNQSLRLGIESLTQTSPTFDNQSLVSQGFSEPVFPASLHMMSLSTRYTVPLWHPDEGGFLIPAYLSNMYLVAFSNTVAALDNRSINTFFENSRTVLGLGIRAQFRLSNLTFDLGIGVGFEPAHNKFNPFVGNF